MIKFICDKNEDICPNFDEEKDKIELLDIDYLVSLLFLKIIRIRILDHYHYVSLLV